MFLCVPAHRSGYVTEQKRETITTAHTKVSRCGKHHVDILALVNKVDDGSYKVLFRKVIQPRLTANETIKYNYHYTRVTQRERSSMIN